MADHPPQAVAMADQMSAEMQDRALKLVREHLAAQGLPLSEDDAMYVEIGIGAATAVTMQVLIERGLLASAG